MIKTEFMNLYEKLSKLTEGKKSSITYVPEVYAIFEYADEYVWDVLWVGTDRNEAWEEWSSTQDWSDKYRGPNYPIYLVEYSEDCENQLTEDELKELTLLVDPKYKDEDQIEEYYDMGLEIKSYYPEYIDEDDYDEDEADED